MRIGFIGGGKVGRAFGKFLVERGYDVAGYASRSLSSAQAAAAFAGTGWFGSPAELAAECDLIFLTVTDDQIRPAAEALAETAALKPGTGAVHMSGALGSDLLEPLRRKGCPAASLHPLLSFADPEQAVRRIPETVFSLEGDPRVLGILKEILEETGCAHFSIATEKKALYHAAACVASNYVTVLIDYAFSLYGAMGLSRDQAAAALMPLVEGTVQNAVAKGPDKTLTGPIARGDAGVIRRHMQALESEEAQQREFYRFMGLRTADYVRRYGLQPEAAINKIETILKRGERHEETIHSQ